jgi:hypothetical protein
MADVNNSWTPASLLLLAMHRDTPPAWRINTGREPGGEVTITNINTGAPRTITTVNAATAVPVPDIKVVNVPSTGPLPVISTIINSSGPSAGPNTIVTVAMPTSDSPVPRAVPISVGPTTAINPASQNKGVTMDTTQVPSWIASLVATLQATAKETVNPQLTTWSNDPALVVALALSESNGNASAVREEGFSAKLGRQYCSFGLFQINELWASSYFSNAVKLIGPTNAKKMPPFPKGATWTRAEAATALLAWPGQLWYAMCVLRGFSQLKNTFFTTMNGSSVVARPVPSSGQTEYRTAGLLGPALSSLSKKLGIPAEAIALKAYWLASSLSGMHKLVSSGDARLSSYATAYKAVAS